MITFQSLIEKYKKDNHQSTFLPKAVLFDMDGVLYDSMENHAYAWEKAMEKFGLNVPAPITYKHEGMRGVETIQILMKEQLGKFVSEEEALEMYHEKARVFETLPKAQIMPGITTLMQTLKAQGLDIVVVTGSAQRPLIERLLTDFEGYIVREKIVSAYDVTRGKPAPDPYLKGLLKAGGLQPNEAIVVENAPLGVSAGVAAGIFTIAVNSGPLPNEVLSSRGAAIVFNSMTELANEWNRKWWEL